MTLGRQVHDAERDRLLRTFRESFGRHAAATHVVQAPGRVNLIGDHTDYNGLPVFPMAIDRAITLLFRPRSDATVRLSNCDLSFEPVSFELHRVIPPRRPGHWGNYAQAAAQALVGRYGLANGFDGVVSGTVPVAAGLSSSSALVVAVALSLITGNGSRVDRVELAEVLARGERYVGTAGGGMDQAICLLAERRSASVIEFDPLRVTPVPVPPTWNFVVAFSLIPAEKSGAAQATYNQRTIECRQALEVLDQSGEVRRATSYRELFHAHPPDVLLDVARRVLPDPLERRFRHVISEATRVWQARTAVLENDPTTFGRLMRESHASLRDAYDVSCPELNTLTEIAQAAGAHGARLTGAGMGGCMVALCEARTVQPVMEALAESFYRTRELGSTLDEHLFVSPPTGGASVIAL